MLNISGNVNSEDGDSRFAQNASNSLREVKYPKTTTIVIVVNLQYHTANFCEKLRHGTWADLKHSTTLKLEAADPSETLVPLYHTARRHIPEDSNIHVKVQPSNIRKEINYPEAKFRINYMGKHRKKCRCSTSILTELDVQKNTMYHNPIQVFHFIMKQFNFPGFKTAEKII
jgi:hypothetical protein